MIDLIKFLIQKITGSDDFQVDETTDEKGVLFTVHAKPEVIGLIIGKEGKTIKNIRRIASIKAILLNQFVSINVTE